MPHVRTAPWSSAFALVAVLATTGCAQVGKYSVRLDEPEWRRARERIQAPGSQELVIETDAGHTLSSESTQAISAQPDGARPLVWRNPQSLQSAVSAVNGGAQLVVVERKRGTVNRRLLNGGGITALAGGGMGLVGLVVVSGAVLVAGPQGDPKRAVIGGGVTMLVGAGVAIVGGIIALVAAAPAIEPGVPSTPEDLGRGRVR